MDCLIIGCGVAGLSSGIRLREAGYDAQIWARDLPPNTTSNVAAAVWYPYKAYPEDLVARWSASTYAELARLLDEPSAGVLMRPGIEIFPYAVGEPWWGAAVPNYRRAAPAELPAGYIDGYVFPSPVIEMPRYLPYLMQRFSALGGRIHTRALASLEEALASSALVINCAGLGARELVGDGSMLAIRGQVLRVAQVGIERFWLDDYGPQGVAYIIPRATDIILGGTAEDGAEQLAPDPAIAEGILERCVRLEPRLAQAQILEHKVGLRPGRPTVRLEAEQRPDGRLIVHNYGHGGAGVTLSWGCADEVAAIVQRMCPLR